MRSRALDFPENHFFFFSLLRSRTLIRGLKYFTRFNTFSKTFSTIIIYKFNIFIFISAMHSILYVYYSYWISKLNIITEEKNVTCIKFVFITIQFNLKGKHFEITFFEYLEIYVKFQLFLNIFNFSSIYIYNNIYIWFIYTVKLRYSEPSMIRNFGSL